MSGGVCVITNPRYGAAFIFEEVMGVLGLQDGAEVDMDTLWKAVDLMTAVMRAHEDAKPEPNPEHIEAFEAIERVIARRNTAIHGRG